MTPTQAKRIANAAVEAAMDELQPRLTLQLSLLDKSVDVYMDGAFVKTFPLVHLLGDSYSHISREESQWEIYFNGANELATLFSRIKGQLVRSYRKEEKKASKA